MAFQQLAREPQFTEPRAQHIIKNGRIVGAVAAKGVPTLTINENLFPMNKRLRMRNGNARVAENRKALTMSKQQYSAPSHLIDFSSSQIDLMVSYRRRMQFGDITLARHTLLPNSGIYLGSEQAIIARYCGAPVHLEWRSPDSDTLHSRTIVRGTVHIKSARQQFWQRWLRPADVLVIAFRPDYFASFSKETGGYDLDLVGQLGINDRTLSDLTALFDRELLDNGANGRLYVESLGAALAIYLMQRGTNKPAIASSHTGLTTSKRLQIIEYIEAHLTRDLSLAELAQVSGLNSHYFAHAFKIAIGLSPHRYIIEQRISRAQRLLAKNRRSIAEIALDCGFSNQSHFTQHFRRMVGTTPAKYRREL